MCRWVRRVSVARVLVLAIFFFLYPNFNTRQKSGIWVCQIAKYMLIQGLPQKKKKSKKRETNLIKKSNNKGIKETR